MRFGVLLLSCFANIAVTAAVLPVMPVSVAFAAPAVSGGSDSDIPLSELNKVKKKTPSKLATNEAKKKKKKKDAKSQKSVSEIAGQAKTSPAESNSVAQSETHPKSPAVSEQSSESEDTRIHHSPYSFVVAGKRTVIQVVVSSKSDIQEVNCAFRALEGGEQDLVKMVRVNGTQFTYTASLPGLSPESPSLRYTIVAVDSLGKVTRSREFVSPVASSPVVPNWQIESVGEAVSVKQEEDKQAAKDLAVPAAPEAVSAGQVSRGF